MRVGLIGPLPPSMGGATPGGVATHQMHLAAALASLSGLEVRLLATNVRAAPCAALPYGIVPLVAPRSIVELVADAKRVGAASLARYAVQLAKGKSLGSRREELGQLLWYRYFLQHAQPDLVHVQHPLERAYFVRRVMDFERRRWPLVITAHSFFGEHEEEVIHDFMAPNLRAAERVIAVSPHVADQAATLGVDRARICVIRSGVDVEQYRPRDRAEARRRLTFDPGERIVLFVGNLEPRKQVPVLLRAMTQVQATLVLVGDGDERNSLTRLATELGSRQKVRFVGRTSDAELRDWYAAADVFALPSSSEAQGIVALEAMASGLPVVASAVGGLLGTIDDGQNGFLVAAGDSSALGERLSMLLGDPAKRREVGEAARAKVAREFTWQRAAEATFEVYQDVLACRGA